MKTLLKLSVAGLLVGMLIGCTGGDAPEAPPPGEKPNVIQGDPNMAPPEMRGGGKGAEKGPDAGQG